MGIAGLVVAMATTLEPAFGGITNFYLSWRWIFIFATIIALVVFIAVILVIGKYHEQVKINFDWLAFVVLAGVFITLTVGVNQISKGITNPLFWLLLVATAVLIWLFIKLSQRSTKKLLDLAVFKQNAFVWGALAYFLLQFNNIGISFVLPNYVQIVSHQNSLVGGLILLPGSIIAGLLNPYLGSL